MRQIIEINKQVTTAVECELITCDYCANTYYRNLTDGEIYKGKEFKYRLKINDDSEKAGVIILDFVHLIV